MSYSYETIDGIVYVDYSGIIDALDIVQITGDQAYMLQLRSLKRVVHDFSAAEKVQIDMEELGKLALLSKIESNFTEQLVGVVIPIDEAGHSRVQTMIKAINNPKWKLFTAKNREEALSIVRNTKFV